MRPKRVSHHVRLPLRYFEILRAYPFLRLWYFSSVRKDLKKKDKKDFIELWRQLDRVDTTILKLLPVSGFCKQMHTSNNKTTRVYIKASQLRASILMVISHIIERNIDVFDQWVSTLLTIQGIAWLLYEHINHVLIFLGHTPKMKTSVSKCNTYYGHL